MRRSGLCSRHDRGRMLRPPPLSGAGRSIKGPPPPSRFPPPPSQRPLALEQMRLRNHSYIRQRVNRVRKYLCDVESERRVGATLTTAPAPNPPPFPTFESPKASDVSLDTSKAGVGPPQCGSGAAGRARHSSASSASAAGRQGNAPTNAPLPLLCAAPHAAPSPPPPSLDPRPPTTPRRRPCWRGARALPPPTPPVGCHAEAHSLLRSF